MFNNISFFLPIVVIAIINTLLIAIPSVLLWIREVLDDHCVSFEKLDKRKVIFYGMILSILFIITETMLLIFVFFSNGLLNTLYCILWQTLLFGIILFIPRLLYFFGNFSIEISKFLFKILTIITDVLLTIISIIFFLPYILFKIIWFCCSLMVKKQK